MGLDTTHEAWHGPYSSFNEWRKWLATRIGIDLHEYIGYPKYDKEKREWDDSGCTKNLKDIKHEIQPLLDHSDCDGELSQDQCKQIASGLQKILKALNLSEKKDFLNKIMIDYTTKFRDGCLLAVRKNEKILFH